MADELLSQAVFAKSLEQEAQDDEPIEAYL